MPGMYWVLNVCCMTGIHDCVLLPALLTVPRQPLLLEQHVLLPDPHPTSTLTLTLTLTPTLTPEILTLGVKSSGRRLCARAFVANCFCRKTWLLLLQAPFPSG